MLQRLIDLDKTILLAVQKWHTPFWDDFMYIFSGQKIWLLTAATIIFVIIKNYKKESWIILLTIVVLMTLSDQISSGFIKPLAERLRPTYEPSLKGLLSIVHNNRASGYSFVSSHAANSFAFASFSALLFRHRLYSWVIIAWSLVTGFSRVYLGVHYPFDVLCGTMVGIGVGCFVYWSLKKIKPKVLEISINQKDINIIIAILGVTLISMTIWHNSLIILG